MFQINTYPSQIQRKEYNENIVIYHLLLFCKTFASICACIFMHAFTYEFINNPDHRVECLFAMVHSQKCPRYYCLASWNGYFPCLQSQISPMSTYPLLKLAAIFCLKNSQTFLSTLRHNKNMNSMTTMVGIKQQICYQMLPENLVIFCQIMWRWKLRKKKSVSQEFHFYHK